MRTAPTRPPGRVVGARGGGEGVQNQWKENNSFKEEEKAKETERTWEASVRGGKLGEHPHTWVALAHVQVVAAADAGGVQRVNAEGGELAPQLLDVTLFAVQCHLKLQSDLVLLRQQLKVKKTVVLASRSTAGAAAQLQLQQQQQHGGPLLVY